MIHVIFTMVGTEGGVWTGDMVALVMDPIIAMESLEDNLPDYVLKQLVSVQMEVAVVPESGLPYWKKCEGLQERIDEFILKHNPFSELPLGLIHPMCKTLH